jgi:hypothetical protein
MKKILFLVLLLVSYISVSAQESVSNNFNPFDIESINHWNLKISSVTWESATIKNALEIP